jgi:hypothetical protein
MFSEWAHLEMSGDGGLLISQTSISLAISFFRCPLDPKTGNVKMKYLKEWNPFRQLNNE